MARIETDPNYTTPTFSRATAGPDIFKKEDVQQLAAAVSTHDHTSGKGARLPSTAFTGSIDVPDWYRSTNHTSAFPSSGTGAELYYDPASSSSYLQSYNRTSSVYAPLVLRGTTVSINTVSADAAGNLTVPGTLAVAGTASISNQLSATQVICTNGNFYLTSTGGPHIWDGGSGTVNMSSHLTVTNNVNVGGTLTVTGATTLSTLHTTSNIQNDGNSTVNGTLNVGGVLTATGDIHANSAGGIYVGPLNRRIYYSSGDQSIHLDWDIRIDSAHDVYTHAIHLVTSGDDCRINTVGDMNYYGPNGGANHRFQHVDNSWMGLQAAAFQVQSSVDHARQFGKLIEPVEDALGKVLAVEPVHYFHMTTLADHSVVDDGSGQQSYGMSAKQLADVLPEAADGETGMIDYNRLVPILWAAVRELSARLEAA